MNNKNIAGVVIVVAALLVIGVGYRQMRVSPDVPSANTISANNPVSDLKVLSPNGGERFESGRPVSIKWVDSRDVSKASIILVDELSPSKEISINRNVENRASGIDGVTMYLWDGVGAPPGSYRVKVCDFETKECDESDASFVLQQ